jgi:type I restriction enzyme, R subunit
MQSLLSSRARMERVGSDIVFDFSVKPRLSSERGNAILEASSIYEACKYYSLFQKTEFRGRCAVVTSYSPRISGRRTATIPGPTCSTILLGRTSTRGGLSRSTTFSKYLFPHR